MRLEKLQEQYYQEDYSVERELESVYEDLSLFGSNQEIRDNVQIQEALLKILRRFPDTIFFYLDSDWIRNLDLKMKIVSTFHDLRKKEGDINFANTISRRLSNAYLDNDINQVFIEIFRDSSESYLLSPLMYKFQFHVHNQDLLVEKIENYQDEKSLFPFSISGLKAIQLGSTLEKSIADRIQGTNSEKVAREVLAVPELLEYDAIKTKILDEISKSDFPWRFLETNFPQMQVISHPIVVNAVFKRKDKICDAISKSSDPSDILRFINRFPAIMQDREIQRAISENDGVKSGYISILTKLTDKPRRLNPYIVDMIKIVEAPWIIEALDHALDTGETTQSIAASFLHSPELLNQERLGPIARKLLRAMMEHCEALQRTGMIPRPSDTQLVACITSLLDNPSIGKNPEKMVLDLLREFPTAILDIWGIPQFGASTKLNDTIYWILTSQSTKIWEKSVVFTGLRQRSELEGVQKFLESTRFEEVIQSLKDTVNNVHRIKDLDSLSRMEARLLGNLLTWHYS